MLSISDYRMDYPNNSNMVLASFFNLKPETQGLLGGILAFLWVAYQQGKKLHENAKKLREIEKSRSLDEQKIKEAAQTELSTAKADLYAVLEKTVSAKSEENALLRERIAKLELMSQTFKEQYDQMVLRDQDKTRRIEHLVAREAALTEENSQLKRRLHGKANRTSNP